MRLPAVPQFYTDDDKLQLGVLSRLTPWLKLLVGNEMMIGERVEIDLVNGVSRPVQHGLGRMPLGWVQVDLRVGKGDPLVTYACNGWNRETIEFLANGSAKLAIWVF